MLETQKYMEIVRSRGERKLPLNRVYRLIRQRDLFLTAYGKLYANKGAMTPGVNPEDTVDGMSLKRIDTIIEQLESGTYQWTPVQRTYMDKKKGGKRPLGKPGWNDKLLQEVIRMVLEAYYEPQFSNYSHGFRPGRGCHTALETIRRNWKGVSWIIEGDIEKCYDNLDHDLLLDIIRQDIHDQRFLKLLKGMLKAGYLEEWTYHQTYSGVPQGGVISPILSNIILNKLDEFVTNELIPQYTQGKHRRTNPEYNRLSGKMNQARREKDLETYRQLEQQRRRIPRGRPNDENFRRLRFCRYADDFALGFIGPKSEASAIKAQIKAFLQTIKLTLSEEKTLITHAVEGRARFLGYDIYVARNNQRITQHQTAHKRKSRAVNGKVMLSVPSEVARQWRTRYTRKGKPIHRADLLNQSDYEIVTAFNVECQGLLNYYILAQNVHKRLAVVRYVFWQSLGKTLAAKHKRKTTWVYRRYTGKLENGRKVIRVVIPREEPKKPLVATFGAKPIRYVKSAVINDEIPRPFYKATELVQRLLANQCELCRSTKDVEVHHVRKLADIRRKYKGRKQPPQWAIFMMSRNRKTIVVCRDCHHKIHAGTYDGSKLN
ncbi:MAG: reverse transcriptase domain-containing protein [Nitrososphaera sp.]|nr:reverse transcriptase domain-containing protein [Nitrososphaera sp.]